MARRASASRSERRFSRSCVGLRRDSDAEPLEQCHATLMATAASLAGDLASVTEMKNSSKESGHARIRELRETAETLEKDLEATRSEVEEAYLRQTTRLQALEEKVQRSERSRRVLSDRIQTLRGNVLAEVCVWQGNAAMGNFVTDVTPDETGISICSSRERSSMIQVDHVFDTGFSPSEVTQSIADYLYAALDGRSIVLLNTGVPATQTVKQGFLFGDGDDALALQATAVLLAQTQRLASLQQRYQFSLSALAVGTGASHSFFQNLKDASASESYVAEEPAVEDLLELGRFSFDPGQQQEIRRKPVRSLEDVREVLGVVTRQRSEEQLAMVVTL